MAKRRVWIIGTLISVAMVGFLAVILPGFFEDACGCDPDATARENMHSVARAVAAYHVRWGVYTADFSALVAELGDPAGPVGPVGRTYRVRIGGGNCTDDKNRPVPGKPTFSVSSTVPRDGVFCPGISPN
jgi:hypothetical protein